MTKSSPAKLLYQKKLRETEEEKRKGVERRRIRRQLIREGVVKIGDGKDVDHKKMLDQGGSGGKNNVRVVSQEENRGWRKDNPGAYTKRKK